MSITEKFLRVPALAGEPYLGHILEPDLPDLTEYVNDTLLKRRTGGAL